MLLGNNFGGNMELKYLYCLLAIAVGVKTSASECVLPDERLDVIVSPSQSSYSLWSHVNLVCPEGHSHFGPDYSYCVDTNVWDPPLDKARCLAQCKEPELSAGVTHTTDGGTSKTVYEHGEVIHYACANGGGATLIGPVEATCSFGEWEPAMFPTCNQCAPPALSDPKVVQVMPSQASYAAYTKITLSCVDDVIYTAVGPASSFCEEGGQWMPDPTKMTCQDKCTAPAHDKQVQSYPQGGSPTDSKILYDFNSVIVNVCPEGKLLAGPARQRCAKGMWLPNNPVTCQ